MACPSLIPGFRFHPTDVELAMFYLKRKLLGKKIAYDVVSEVNIYDFGPWDLPDKSSLKSGDLEWYFFCPKSKKYSSGGRSNRATETGFWKATGKDRTVKYNGRTVATIKTLVFHIGHKGKGDRTDWVMHEYKMEDEHLANLGIVQDMYVLCKVFQKSGSGPKNGAQYGAPFKEEEWGDDSQLVACPVGASNTMDIEQEEGPPTMNPTEDGSPVVYVSANTPGPATMNVTEHVPSSGVVSAPQNTHGAPEPGSPGGLLPVTDMNFDLPSINDCVSFEDFDDLIRISEDNEAAANNIDKELVNLIDVDDLNKIEFKPDGDDYILDQLFAFDELD